MKKSKKQIAFYAVGIFLILLLVVLAGLYGYRAMGKQKIKNSILEGEQKSSISKEIEYKGKEYKFREGIINILCLGIAKETAMEAQVTDATSMGQSDAVYLVSLDTENNKLKILSIPRETMVPVQMYNMNGEYVGTEQKQLTLQYAYGDGKEKSARLTLDRVEEVLEQIPIHRVCALNYAAVPILNDAVGGVTVTVTEDFSTLTDEFVQGSTITLKGEQSIGYLRIRDTKVFKSSVDRVKRQEEYLMSFAGQAKKAVKKNPALPIEMYRVLRDNMYTDISPDEVTYLAAEMLDYGIEEDNLYTLDGDTKVVDGHEAFYPNEEAVSETLREMFYQEVE